MSIDKEDIDKFMNAFEKLIVKLMEVDNSCVELTQDVNKQELSLIGFVGNEEAVIMRDISNFLDVPYSTTTGIVDKLVDKGYLLRYNSVQDRRSVMVSLSTEKGKNLYDLYTDMRSTLGERILGQLNKSDRSELVNLMGKVLSNLNNQTVEEEEVD